MSNKKRKKLMAKLKKDRERIEREEAPAVQWVPGAVSQSSPDTTYSGIEIVSQQPEVGHRVYQVDRDGPDWWKDAWAKTDCQQAQIISDTSEGVNYATATIITCNNCDVCRRAEAEFRQSVQSEVSNLDDEKVIAREGDDDDDMDSEEEEGWRDEARNIRHYLQQAPGSLHRANGRMLSGIECESCRFFLGESGEPVYGFMNEKKQSMPYGFYCEDCMRGIFAVDPKLMDEIPLFIPR